MFGSKRQIDYITSKMEEEKIKDAIGEIFSKKWKRKAFEFVVKMTRDGNRYVSGFELHRRFGAHISTAYKFIHKMKEYGIFTYPLESEITGIVKVKITKRGEEIYESIKHFLD